MRHERLQPFTNSDGTSSETEQGKHKSTCRHNSVPKHCWQFKISTAHAPRFGILLVRFSFSIAEGVKTARPSAATHSAAESEGAGSATSLTSASSVLRFICYLQKLGFLRRRQGSDKPDVAALVLAMRRAVWTCARGCRWPGRSRGAATTRASGLHLGGTPQHRVHRLRPARGKICLPRR